MPKELIHGDRENPAYGTPEAAEAYTAVEVRWNRETGYFQIATKMVDAVTGDDFIPMLEPIEVPLGNSANTAELIELTAEPLRSGIYASLDRRGINQLIKVLRRARDAAYGRDE